jgi:phosphoribosylformylglycinamidine cyclo-ligase
MPPIFELIRAKGRIPERELYQVFNMGIGMCLFAAAARAEAILRRVRALGQEAWIIGEVVRGSGIARVE